MASLADINAESGDFAQAIIEQEKGVALDPGDTVLRSNLSLFNLAIEDRSTAQDVLEDAKKISPQHFSYVFIQANINVFAGKYQAALQATTEVVTSDPDNTGLKDFHALMHALNGDCDSALNVWRSAGPEKFTAEYALDDRGPINESAIAWCLKQTGNDRPRNSCLKKFKVF